MVYKGIYTRNGITIVVAIKTIKSKHCYYVCTLYMHALKSLNFSWFSAQN